MDLLKALIVVSEKAANIARLLRQNERLFEKLVEVKSNSDANPKFQEDLKTLADVLIQEMVKYDIGLQFPSLQDKIYGEESNHFFNQVLNEEVVVEVRNTKEDTEKLLSEILNNDTETANLLASEVHRVVSIEDVNTKIPDQKFEIDVNQLGIWIDPIDGTNEYVRGINEDKVENFYLKGLQCVTVLIGVYDDKGQPIMGVINQPFCKKTNKEDYQCHWGVCFKNQDTEIKLSSITTAEELETNIVCVGSGEDNTVTKNLEESGFRLVVSRGAGYKLLTVCLGLADAYVLSKATTFLWDTCAPQAILRALGGNIVEMDSITRKKKINIRYNIGNDNSKANKHGIIAYRNETILEKLMDLPWATQKNSPILIISKLAKYISF